MGCEKHQSLKENPISLSLKLIYDYTNLADLFSVSEGITIEHYFIANKIEKVRDAPF